MAVPYLVKHTGLEFGKLRVLLERIQAAYRRGKASRELLSVGFDELWDKQVSDIGRLICSPGPSPA
jgi:ubiquinone biosynthesis protein Coq4